MSLSEKGTMRSINVALLASLILTHPIFCHSIFHMEESADLSLNTYDPSLRATIIRQYDTHGKKFVLKEYGVTDRTIRNWKRLKTTTGTLEPGFAACGRHSTLAPGDMKKIEKELIKNPFATNTELAAKIKNKISPSAVGKALKKSEHQFTWKLESVDVEETFNADVVKETQKFLNKIKSIPEDDRIYVDETYASSGIKRRRGRFPKNKKPWSPRNRKYARMVIIGAITKQGWLHPGKIYNKPTISDDDFDTYVIKTLCPRLKRGQTVFWDRYGRSGRAKNPKARHFSPKAKKAIENVGANLEMLPRYGKYADPIELIFGDTKKNYEKKIGKEMESRMPSKIPFETKVKHWHAAERSLTPKNFKRAYYERASGREFNRVCKERGLL
jgi:transposase